VAQEKPAETMKSQEPPAEAMMKPSKPGPEMEKLKKTFLGTWRTTEKHEPSMWMPKGGTGKGTATYKLGPGGLSLIEDYRSSSSMGGKFMGHGVIWWDDKEKGYKSIWCDNMSPGGCEVSRGVGRWEGNAIMFDNETEMGEQKMKMTMKEVITDITPKGFTFTMDMGPTGGEIKRVMTIKYARAGAAKSGEQAAETKKP
jgi:hypothetical protein